MARSIWKRCGTTVRVTDGAVREGVAERKCESQCVLKSHHPATADNTARITSGSVMTVGDSCAWCPASSGTRVGPVNVMKTARNV